MEDHKGSGSSRRPTVLGALLIGVPLALGAHALARAHARRIRKRLLTSLHDAVQKGNKDEIDRLLAAGAQINAEDSLGLTAYMHAIQHGFTDIAEHLETKGANITLTVPSPEVIANKVMDENEKKAKSALVVRVAQEGQTLYERAIGYADVERKIKADGNTKFIVGSITKQFVAAAILKLQEDKKLRVTDKLSQYYPEFERDGATKITLHHLLTHTSGVSSYISLMYLPRLGSELADVEGLIKELAMLNLDFEPGEKYRYSNSNYLLLGNIVSKVTGKSLAETLKQFFFDPLGMTNTTLFEVDEECGNVAKDSLYPGGVGRKQPILHWSWSRQGSGGIRSTVRDLTRWTKALFEGKVLNKASLKASFTPPELGDGSDSFYGYGWRAEKVAESRGLRFVMHSGEANGFTALLCHCVDNGITMVALSNGVLKTRSILSVLDRSYFWEKLNPRSPVKVHHPENPRMVEKLFQGYYDFGTEWTLLEIRYESGRVLGSGAMMGSKEEELLLVDGGKVVIDRRFEPVLKFKPSCIDEEGHAVVLLASMESRKKTHEGKRVEVNKVKRSVLRRYVGKYEGGVRLNIKGGGLIVSHEKYTKEVFRLEPESSTKFFSREKNRLAIEFVVERDEDKAREIILKEGNNHVTLSRV